MQNFIRGCWGLWLVLILAGCASPMRGNLEAYPPMPNDKAPGASPQALQVARLMGPGVNFGNMMEAPNEGDWGLIVKPEFIDVAVRAGFTTVRLPVRWSNHAGKQRPFRLDAAFAKRVEGVVDTLLDKGMMVVLNMHHYRGLDGDPPDPGDEVQDESFSDERFLALWQQIAQRYRFKGERLLFELYNEPHGKLDVPHWNELMARATAVVRKSNPERVLILGPVGWGNADKLGAMRLPNDPHLLVSVHHYAPFNFTHQGAPWIKPVLPVGVACCNAEQQAEILRPLDQARQWSEQNKYPIFVGEFGAYKDADQAARARYTRFVREHIEQRGFTWAYWELASHFGVYDPLAGQFRKDLLDALMVAADSPSQP